MKVCIIGAGIFGTNIALMLAKLNFINEIVIFEKNSDILKEAAVNNQHRYHLGYHYPRSPETIEQILFTNKLFNQYYKDAVFEIKNNLYFVSRYNSFIDTQMFKTIFKNHNIREMQLNNYKNYINVNNLESSFIVEEKGINTSLLVNLIKLYLSNNSKIKIQYNSEILNIEKLKKNYNFVINCSYFNKSMSDSLPLKYEVCLLPLLKQPFNNENNFAFTVVDGEFPSLYPTQNPNIFTLSHVRKTPLIKTDSLVEAKKFRHSLSKIELSKYSKDIIDESRQFFSFHNIDVVDYYVSYKVKNKDDKNELRTSNITYDDNTITILQGKITTCIFIAQEISKYVENYNNR